MPARSLTRILSALLTATLLVAPAAAGARPATSHAKKAHAAKKARVAPGECPGRDVLPTPGNLGAVRAAIVCLHNQIRAGRGLPLLRENRRLRRAAAGHSATMVSQGYFAHTDPSGATFVDRLLGARYARPGQGWTLGENLAWGTGGFATPGATMDAWMGSPEHRANILRRSFREIGVGIVSGVPSDPTAGATFTADFGAKR